MATPIEPFLEAFIQATETTLQDLCRIPIRGHRLMHPGEIDGQEVALAGLIGITSTQIKGSMSIQFPSSLYLDLMNGMLEESWTELAPGMEDGATELTNIIFGNAKAALNQHGFGIQMAMPTLLTGSAIRNVNGQSSALRALEFKTDGESLFVVFDLRDVSQEVRPPEPAQRKAWSPEMLLEFVRAVRKTLEVQFSARVEVGSPFKKDTQPPFSFDVGSVIGVHETGFSGYFGLYYQSSPFLALMNRLLGTEFQELNSEVQDGASEITNICFGVAKQALNSSGHAIQMALPNLMVGREIRSSSSGSGRSAIVVPFSIPEGKFWIEFSYQETPDRMEDLQAKGP